MRDYFISYASEDRTRARQLMEALESDGASCFIDYRDIEPGHPRYRDRLIEGIGDCEFIVVLVSDCSQASDEVFREVQAAHDRGRRRIAVWLGERSPYTNGTLELLLGSSQDVLWGSESAADLASRIRATATVSMLRDALTGYESVVNRLEVDLSSVFAAVDRQDLNGAVAHVRQISVAILRQLWANYGLPAPPPDDMQQLILGCRDHFEHQSLLAAFATIEDTARAVTIRRASMDAATRVIDQLMSVLSVLRTRRWGLDELSPRLRVDASFLSGLLIEAGWLQGSELAPRQDVVYMVFERARGDAKRYLEILLGENEEAIDRISQESEGRIFPPTDAPVATRFLVLAGPEPHTVSGQRSYLTPDEFVMRFTGVRRFESEADPAEATPLTQAVMRALANNDGRGNILVYGPPGVGKSESLRTLAVSGWPGAPTLRFFVDYSAADLRTSEQALDIQLRDRFPVEVQPRTRELVSYLVRTGRAALVLDSIECATTFDQPVQVARTFARLCSFLSEESTVIMAGRDAALRDSATVREFFLGEPAVSDVLFHTMRSTGVDSSRLPRLSMVRARRRRRFTVSTPQDRLIEVLATDIWEAEESIAARTLANTMPVHKMIRADSDFPALAPEQIRSMALGGTPEQAEDRFDVDPMSRAEVGGRRQLRELRAAFDYVRAAVVGVAPERWDDVSVGETTRRLIRLISVIAVTDSAAASARLALVGPANCIVAVTTSSRPELSATPVTAGEFRKFTRAISTMTSLANLSPELPNEALLHPMYERIVDGYYRDEKYSDHPAVGVSWWAADSYARWSGTRLPTSLEWEIVGRGWDGRLFPWGDDARNSYINCADQSAGRPILDYSMWREAMRADVIAPRAARPCAAAMNNLSATGRADMVGNVWEWVSTDLGEHRVLAGGSYDNPLRACVLSSRSVATPTTRSNAVGFRVIG